MSDDRLDRYARVALEVGTNFQAGQDLAISCQIEHAPFARAVARAAYAAGAHYVDIWYWDPHAKRARIEHAPEDTLTWTPPWLDRRNEYLGENHGARLAITGDPEPDLLDGLDPKRVGLDQMPRLASALKIARSGAVNWTVVSYPTEGWARAVFGEPDVERLWRHLEEFLRLDRPDPVAAWNEHIGKLLDRARRLNERRLDSLHYRGPGTDLTVGLLPGSTWKAAELETRWGLMFRPNLPTEEVFTTPDARRTEGTVRATRPLAMAGSIVRDLELSFSAGRIDKVEASAGADVVRKQIETDEGASRVGEVALVDGSSPIGRSGIIFFDTLLDENATCHIAWGAGFPFAVSGAEGLDEAELARMGVNESKVHTDFMIGSPELEVDGIDSSGTRVPILLADQWQLT
jgi:aminopeptidase